jgi:hypothetical protein
MTSIIVLRERGRGDGEGGRERGFRAGGRHRGDVTEILYTFRKIFSYASITRQKPNNSNPTSSTLYHLQSAASAAMPVGPSSVAAAMPARVELVIRIGPDRWLNR